MRRTGLLLIAGLAFALTSCKQSEPAAGTEPIANSKLGMIVSDGRLVLPAVSRRPGAAYFSIANNGPKPATLTSLTIDQAQTAEMHETSGGSMVPLAKLDLAAGQQAVFANGGKHVMVFGIAPEVVVGSEVTMTLRFADGDTIALPLKVEAPGMAMDHGAMN